MVLLVLNAKCFSFIPFDYSSFNLFFLNIFFRSTGRLYTWKSFEYASYSLLHCQTMFSNKRRPCAMHTNTSNSYANTLNTPHTLCSVLLLLFQCFYYYINLDTERRYRVYVQKTKETQREENNIQKIKRRNKNWNVEQFYFDMSIWFFSV